MTEKREIPELIDRELERLHKLVEQGICYEWAMREITRLNTFLYNPPVFIEKETGEIKFAR